MIYGILSISNGFGLNYPIPPVLLSLSGLCDGVLVGTDDSNYPVDRVIIESLGFPNVICLNSPWNRDVDSGREIAAQMDKLVDHAKGLGAEWVVVVQADEVLHQDDFSMIRRFIARADESGDGVAGFSLERLYFWGSLDKVRQDWNARLIRIFKPDYFSFLAENTDKGGMYAGAIEPCNVVDLSYQIHHYSRVGYARDISRRVRNLDSFFHQAEDLVPENMLPPYDFKGREYDNFNVVSPPPVREPVIIDYKGTHPLGVKEWYDTEQET